MKLLYVDNFRSIAISLIVFNHVRSIFDWKLNVSIENFLIVLVENATVLFIFVSGYLFSYLIDRYSYKRFLISKVKYVLFPYILCSIPAILYFTLFKEREGVPDEFYSSSVLFKVAYFYFTGIHLAPYWYIPTIFLYFLTSPIFYFLHSRKLLLWLLPFLIAVSLNIGRLDVIPSALHFISVYVLGMIFCQYKDILNTYLNKSAVIISLLVIYLVTFYMQYTINVYSLSLMYFNKLILAVLVLALTYSFYRDKLFSFNIAGTSFGIFFLHSYFISAFKIFYDKFSGVRLEGGGIQVLLMCGLIIFISHYTVVLIKKVFPNKSRLLVGS